MVKAVILDFGGVLAEEGFREGLKAIAERNGLAPEPFFAAAQELIHQTGYVTGSCDEARYWSVLKQSTGIKGNSTQYRREILNRFVLRDRMVGIVKRMRSHGLITALLSDQTNWLDEINRRSHFYRHFDFVFNSYVLKKSKRDPSVFRDVCDIIGIKPREALFVDDTIGNIRNAESAGMRTILFRSVEEFETALGEKLR